MIERNKYIFPPSGNPDELPPIPDDLPGNPQKSTASYIKFVQSKNICDILHQIQMAAYRGKQKELNILFRLALESILIYVDNTGELDTIYQNSFKEKEND